MHSMFAHFEQNIFLPQPLLRQLDYCLRFEKDCDGNIPLHIACAHNNLKALEHGLLKPEPGLWEDDEDGGSDEMDGGSGGGSDGGSDGGSGKEEVCTYIQYMCIAL